ncbi:phosphoglycerate mutase [Candidatus Micrarchaeota archaeon]|nr:phosphoglycerate mutase [Candidatus Micrarchaeota archaeon]
MKQLLVVLDGVGDLPHPDLNGKTPLQAAKAQYLQKLAKNGTVGHLRIAKHIAPESDVGVCSVLGHNPFVEHVGRGLLEAKGANVPFKTGDLALRANFATAATDGNTLLDRRVGRGLDQSDAKALAAEINANVKLSGGATFQFIATKGHRGVLVIHEKTTSGEHLNAHITNTDPAYEVIDGLGSAKSTFDMKIAECVAWKKEGGSKRAAELVNEFTHKSFAVLEKSAVNARRKSEKNLPANCILLRDPESQDKKLKPLPGKWAILSEMPMEEGIAQLMGMAIEPMYHDKDLEKAYPKIAQQTADAIQKYDGLYVHLKGPDVFGHDGDAKGKMKSIEQIDAYFFKPLLEKLDLKVVRIAVTGDHSTPCTLFAHSADPVPYLVSGAGMEAENGPFDETNTGATINGWDLMPKLLGR